MKYRRSFAYYAGRYVLGPAIFLLAAVLVVGLAALVLRGVYFLFTGQ